MTVIAVTVVFGLGAGWFFFHRQGTPERNYQTLVTRACASTLTDLFGQMVGKDRPTLTIREFSYLPQELDHFVGYAEIQTTAGSKFSNVQDIVDAAFKKCSSSSFMALDLSDPLFGERLEQELRHRKEIGAKYTTMRLVGDELQIFGVDVR